MMIEFPTYTTPFFVCGLILIVVRVVNTLNSKKTVIIRRIIITTLYNRYTH